jgi:hypothetical protein
MRLCISPLGLIHSGLASRVRTGETHAVLSFGTLFSCQGAPSLPPVGADSRSALLVSSVVRGAITARGGTPTPDHHFGKESSPTRGDGARTIASCPVMVKARSSQPGGAERCQPPELGPLFPASPIFLNISLLGRQPHETALAHLHHRIDKAPSRQFVGEHPFAVDLDCSLFDQPSGLRARSSQTELPQ